MAETVNSFEESPHAHAEGAYGIVANVLWDRVLRMSAKVYLLGWHGDFENVYVWGLGKHGRRIRKYLPMKRLYHYRAAWLPPHVRGLGWFGCLEKAQAQHLAEDLNVFWHGVQCFSTAGMTCLQPGISVSEAFARHGQRV